MINPSTDFDHKYNIIDIETPRHAVLCGQYKKSFAYYTLRERLPVTLTRIIDQLTKDYNEIAENHAGEDTCEDVKYVVGQLSKLKYQLQTDKPFENFNGDEPDRELWNNFISCLPNKGNSFFRACWLYSECYMYRKVSAFFENNKSLKNYDYFAKQKENIIELNGVKGLAKVIRGCEKDEKTFKKFLKLNLWGNKCDLSLKLPNEFKPTESLYNELDEFDSKILINDSKQIWKCLEQADHSKPVIVEIIDDNAGFEFYTDLLLADYLIDKHLATEVRFSVKPIPWFVSDVTPKDVTWLLDYLSSHSSPNIKEQGLRLKHYFEEGKFKLSPVNYFWVSPYEFYKMREFDKDLYEYLAEAHLVIFKGDLNYRKLLGDMNWDPTNDFSSCLRGFQPTNICTLRTIKSDLVCGLPKGKAEELVRLDPQWMCTGEYGLIQFSGKISV